MPYSHFAAKMIANNGFVQKCTNPSAPTGSNNAYYHSAEMAAVLAMSYTTASYQIAIPKKAIITGVKLIVISAFSGGSASLAVGSTAAGTDIISQSSLASASYIPLVPVLTSGAQWLYITLNSGLVAGSGYLVITYVNTDSNTGYTVGGVSTNS